MELKRGMGLAFEVRSLTGVSSVGTFGNIHRPEHATAGFDRAVAILPHRVENDGLVTGIHFMELHFYPTQPWIGNNHSID